MNDIIEGFSSAPIPVLIPAYKPDARMVALCRELREAGLWVLLVDDGGGAAYAPLFAEAEALGCAVARHAVNLGKGRALKTGLNAALLTWPDIGGVVTADADGQHSARDILRVMRAMRETPGTLVSGARALRGDVPFKSRAGNTITRYVYRLVTGVRCHDTQTGLRGIPAEKLAEMLRLPGERYEYEMEMLLRLSAMELPLKEIEIETIYIDDNKGSHFHPLRDALRVYSVIFRFAASSAFCFLVDYGLYLALLRGAGLIPWACYGLARVVSSLLNYGINRAAVFGGRGGKGSILRYYALAVAQMAAGALLVTGLNLWLGVSAGWIKIPVDIALFFAGYFIQREFVFVAPRGQTPNRKGD